LTPDPFTALAPPQAAEGAELLDRLVKFVRRFVVLTDAQAVAVALWIVHTHTVGSAETTPYLWTSSAEKRSGKSRLLEVLALLVARPLRAAAVTEAALFRVIADRQPTLLMDEVDAIFGPKAHDHENLRALLNAGYRRGTPALRCVGEDSKQRVEEFAVFCPKALSGIGRLPDTIADRSILIRLKRRARSEPIEQFREREATYEAEQLRADLAAWAEHHDEALANARPALPEELDDRAQDACEQLIAIADLAGGEWPQRARRALVDLRTGAADEEDTDSLGVRLLADVRTVFDSKGVDRISSKELVAELREDAEAPWADLRGGDGLTQRSLANLLRGFGIHSRTVRLDDGTARGYHREAFEDAWTRYLPDSAFPSDTSDTTAQPSQKQPVFQVTQEASVSDRKSGANPHGQRDVSDVSDRNAKTGAGRVAAAPVDESRGSEADPFAQTELDWR
jgi:Protein of unknown function (DUF3631)